jgi:hypothetical protein
MRALPSLLGFAAAILLQLPLQMGAGASVAFADEFEYGSDYHAADVLPAKALKGPHYAIRDQVRSDGFMLTYTVDSDYGVFTATGAYALQKLLNEIQVIAQLKEISQGEAFGHAVGEAAKSPFRFAGNLLTDPVDTISGVPSGLFSIFENVGQSVSEEHDPSEDSRAKQALFVSSWKRDYCAPLGCDVYSSNKALQEELNRIGWAAAIGGLTVSGATTVASGGAVAVFSAGRTAQQVTEALRSEPPSRLRIINEEKLQAMGVPAALIQKFLDHPAFTPRHDTVIVAALAQLKGVKGRDRFIQLCLRAQDEVGANYFQNVAEIMVGYHTKVAKLKEIVPIRGIVAVSAANGRTLVPLAWDYGIYEQAVAQRMDDAVKVQKKRGLAAKFDVWTTGQCSKRLKQEAAARGFKVTENIEKTVAITQ